MSRKIAVISDIHGNHHALSSVVEDMENFDIDAVYCLGDIVSIGHQTNEVLELLDRLENLSIIRGNHDEEVVQALRGLPSEVTGPEHDHHLWVAEHLDGDYRQFLEALPLTLEKQVEDYSILLTHYHLDADAAYTSIDPAPSVERLTQLYQADPHEVILFGHDHMKYQFEAHQVFLNPGPLGVTSKPYAPYAIMEFTGDGAIHIMHRNIHYDRSAFISGLRKENPPALDFILNILLKERG